MTRAATRMPSELDAAARRLRPAVEHALRAAVRGAYQPSPETEALALMYGQMEYHLGWRQSDLRPASEHPGKLLRPMLLLLACELAAEHAQLAPGEVAAQVERALPAAVAVELVHNYSLIHDDIEDGDEMRRDRPTLWKLWGVPQAINTGDGMFSLARLQMWDLAARGVEPAVALRLAAILDRTCLALCEGQHLDMAHEGRHDITPAMYLAMIGRKTAALMACAAEMGAWLGAPAAEELAPRFAAFGSALGVAFQVRDDLLGIWDAESLGKSAAGDLYRRKMSLPVILAFERADRTDRALLEDLYAAPNRPTAEQVATLLTILERTDAHAASRAILRTTCEDATTALAAVGARQSDAARALHALLAFVAATAE